MAGCKLKLPRAVAPDQGPAHASKDQEGRDHGALWENHPIQALIPRNLRQGLGLMAGALNDRQVRVFGEPLVAG
jgi:hypothetical protein